MPDLSSKLRIENSKNISGELQNTDRINIIKNQNYWVEDLPLDGNAPKQFIKVYAYSKGSGIRKENLKSWTPYIAKTAEKWYPHESVIEYMANRIGQKIGLNINDVKLCVINKQIRFLSKFFLKKNQTLIHGAEICGQYLEDMEFAKEIANEKLTARELFTFEFIVKAINKIFPDTSESITKELIKMLIFDALIGNNDRHFYNWGVIANTKKVSSEPHKFSPVYDSARALLWNINDETVIKYKKGLLSNGKQVVNYIDGACPRISIEGNKEINHFGLMEFLKGFSREYKKTIESLASLEQQELVINMLKVEFFPFFILERSELTTYIINERFKRIREL